MKSLSFSCFLLASTLAAFASIPALPVEKLKLGDWEDDIGYRQAVRVGNTVFISGTVGTGPMPVAMREAYGVLETTLKHFGLTFAHVVKETIHTTDFEALKANLAVRRGFYGKDFPAATWVQVGRLYEPNHVIEIELVAVIPEPAK
ncbi:RidA family protein [Oleiharenicola lentus]|jgi:enamine deaminase RidA (YjgF/YER057c/UK114 family)|uniref:RidA family protein n=1 Tax=Oleiharenicola lentus TaxID=2508720 RepID=A0A4Q1C3P9_9BACT|nr:Rid family hydrolase [Oleiharenicola lentus]RXK52980.1 RidA family protein [Oleiharenicola lentus]